MSDDVWWGDLSPEQRPTGMTATYEDDDPIVARVRGCLGILVGLLAVVVVAAWWFA